MTELPENFLLLHQGEEALRSKTIEMIEGHATLPEHFEIVERAMSLFDHFAHRQPIEDDDQLIVQLLGIRLFNACASNILLLMSGYYQAAASGLRDMLEVSFLLEYFLLDKKRIAEWRGSTESQRMKSFGPAKVRIALDERDGFTEKKREAHYKMLCELGAHASMKGFEMLRPEPGGDAHCGPFLSERSLLPVVEELAKISVTAANAFTRFFDTKTKTDANTKSAFAKQQGLWFERFFGRTYDSTVADTLAALAIRLPD